VRSANPAELSELVCPNAIGASETAARAIDAVAAFFMAVLLPGAKRQSAAADCCHNLINSVLQWPGYDCWTKAQAYSGAAAASSPTAETCIAREYYLEAQTMAIKVQTLNGLGFYENSPRRDRSRAGS
jgi:hypothetical protein